MPFHAFILCRLASWYACAFFFFWFGWLVGCLVQNGTGVCKNTKWCNKIILLPRAVRDFDMFFPLFFFIGGTFFAAAVVVGL